MLRSALCAMSGMDLYVREVIQHAACSSMARASATLERERPGL